MAELASFEELLELLESLHGRLVQARDDSKVLSAEGELTRLRPDPELDERWRALGVEGEGADSFLIGDAGRLDLFRSEFVAATWNEEWHWLTIRTTRGALEVVDSLWGR